MVNVVKCLHSLTLRPTRNDEDEDNDHNDDSQLSLNRLYIRDFLKGAQG